MPIEITVALIAFLGTAIGSAGGVVASNTVTQHRLKELEKKVDKHNNLVERMYKTEGRLDNLEGKVQGVKL